jgi:hypothetical protein
VEASHHQRVPEFVSEKEAAGMSKSDCKHESFDCACTVNRLEDIKRFQLDVKVVCLDCGTPFRFIGLPSGLDLNGAAVSVDGTEGRFAIAPKGEVITQLDEKTALGSPSEEPNEDPLPTAASHLPRRRPLRGARLPQADASGLRSNAHFCERHGGWRTTGYSLQHR